jgi:hypothetical protein
MNSTNSSGKKNLAQLTAEEESAREKAIDFYRYVGKSEADVDRLAWADVQKAFPRLKQCDDVPAATESHSRKPRLT